ncbi:hypothetical protein FBD94_16355 [Pedobacter hiemivivus]|uniref:Uncharacterized protein n=1 Tax=Pedobacter hiemivivus TaxID=2530454 RepID=A0A4U1G5S2_9SPHI|nr:hypothetical protein [Pedobacter hiemivivus]TKC59107.1 hypothetical protein FBD94_16355 [Pedobacter hiemivivus]
MTNYLNPTLKSLTIVLAVMLLFLGCKKDETTVTQWGNMAEAKLTEIKTLASDIPCSQKDNVSIQEISTGCSTSYYSVKSSDVTKFENLRKDYFYLLGKQTDAMVKMGIIIDPCYEYIWTTEQSIRLECNGDKVRLITSANISIEEAKPLAIKTYEEIMTIVNAQTCTNESSWMPTALLKDKIMELEYIPYLRTQDYTILKKKVSLYNGLKHRIIQAQGPADYVPVTIKVEKIECVNGKPVVKLTK